MRSIPGTITEYTKHADQVALLDLSPEERHKAIRASILAEARANADAALAEVARLESEA